MQGQLVDGKVYYKIFDNRFKQSTHVYAKYRYHETEKLHEIERNLKAVIEEMQGKQLAILKQVHGTNVINFDDISNFNNEPEADAIYTTKSNIIIGIQTADCVPLLLASEDGAVIGGAHCGWRSAKANILDKLVSEMRKKSKSEIKAVVGPSIQQPSYEVSEEYYQEFLKDSKAFKKFFIPSIKEKHYVFNLPAFVIEKLNNAGINSITWINEDTYSNPDKYPSYRRDCHQGKQYKYNILSTIMIR